MKKETKQTKQKEKTMVISKEEYEHLKYNNNNLECYKEGFSKQLARAERLIKIIERHNSKWYNRKIKY